MTTLKTITDHTENVVTSKNEIIDLYMTAFDQQGNIYLTPDFGTSYTLYATIDEAATLEKFGFDLSDLWQNTSEEFEHQF